MPSIKIDDDTYSRLKAESKRDGRSMIFIVRWAIKMYLEQVKGAPRG
jgi:predicted DNA-binding protein